MDCKACEEKFEWNHEVIVVNEDLYHKECLQLYPTGFYAFLGGEILGETENEDGQMACEIIPELFGDEE